MGCKHHVRNWPETLSRKLLLKGRANRVEDALSKLGETAADNKHLWIQDRNQRTHGHSEMLGGLIDKPEGSRILFLNGPVCLMTTQGPSFVPKFPKPGAQWIGAVGQQIRFSEQGGTRGILLNASEATAAAGQALVNHGDVAQLATNSKASTHQVAIGNHRTSDPGAQGQHHHRSVVSCASKLELGPAGGIGVIFDYDGSSDSLFEAGSEWLVSPTQVRGVKNGGLSGINKPGGRYAYCFNLVGLFRKFNNQSRDNIDHSIGVLSRRLDPLLGHNLALSVNRCTKDLGAADVNSDA